MEVLRLKNSLGQEAAQSVTVVVVPAAGITSFTSNPGSITVGGSATLSWSVSNAASVSMDGIGAVTGSSLTVSPPTTTTYTLRAKNSLGSEVTATAAVTVVAKASLSFRASVASVKPGGNSTLTWEVGGATAVTLDGVSVGATGSKAVSPTSTTTYTLRATNSLGDASEASVTVEVVPLVLRWVKDIVYVGAKELAEVDAEGIHGVITDHVGSPRFIVNGQGQVESEQKFLPFGESLTNPAAAAKFGKGFTNHEQTDPSGLIYMQARFYAPWYGRFLSPDPARDQHFEETQSWNIYSYVQNNPVIAIDPNGMELRLATTDANSQKAFNTAIAYLKKSPTYGRAISTVDASKKVTWVYVMPGAGRADQTGDRIAWDPTNGTRVKKDNGETTSQVQSPAVNLGHELGHRAEELEHPQEYSKNTSTPAGKYDDKEEQRNIQKVETPGNKELGEPTRTNHAGENVTVQGPTSRTSVVAPPPPPKKKEEPK